MGLLDTVTKFIPGFKTVEGLGRGLSRVLQGDFKGAAKAVVKGLSDDWGAWFIPGIGTGVKLATLGAATALDMTGALDDNNARQQDSMQYAGQRYQQGGQGGQGGQAPPIQGPNIGW